MGKNDLSRSYVTYSQGILESLQGDRPQIVHWLHLRRVTP